MLSYWERRSFTSYRYAVIGGGLVGLSTALSLKELDPTASIVVLERGIIPKGASTRNAGFACFGSLTELLSDIESMGEEAARQLVSDRWKGLELLRTRIGDQTMNFHNHGGYELILEQELDCLNQLDRVNEMLHPVFGKDVFSVDHTLVKKFGFNARKIAGMVVNPLEGQLDTGEMMRSLINLAKAQGVDYLTGASVKNFDSSSDEVILNVSYAAPETIQFRARRIAVCTNAFSHLLLPKLEINPGRGLVLITEEIKNLKFKGVFHYDQGYYYFRNVGSRVLFGGGRNLDFESESTTDFGFNELIIDQLFTDLSEVILPGIKFDIDCKWSGIMAFGEDKRPLVGLHTPKVGYAVRLGGMGVALGSLVGSRLARLICINHENS